MSDFLDSLRTYKAKNVVPCPLAIEAKGQLGHYEFRSGGTTGRVIEYCRFSCCGGVFLYESTIGETNIFLDFSSLSN